MLFRKKEDFLFLIKTKGVEYLDYVLLAFIVSVIGFIIVVLWAIIYFTSFKHEFTGRILVGGRPAIKTWKCREVFDKKLQKKLWKPRGKGLKKFERPPEEAINVNMRRKGAYASEGYIDNDGHISDFVIIQEETDEFGLKKWKSRNLSRNTKIVVYNELEKAHKKEHGDGFWQKHGGTVILGSFFLIIIVIGAVFWDDVITPLTQETAQARQHNQQMLQRWENITHSWERTMKIQAELISNEQYIS